MDQASDPLAYLINFGAVGAFLVLWLTGLVVSKRENDRERERAEQWKQYFDQESESHDVTRQALARERERQDASTEAGRTAAVLLSALGHRSIPGGGP